jgi:hypothetical protein
MSAENAAEAETLKQYVCARARNTHSIAISSLIMRIFRIEFKDLCSKVQEDHFLSCLLVILEYACELMKCHYQMSDWHKRAEEYV